MDGGIGRSGPSTKIVGSKVLPRPDPSHKSLGDEFDGPRKSFTKDTESEVELRSRTFSDTE